MSSQFIRFRIAGSVKPEPSERSALRAIPEITEPSVSRAPSTAHQQALQSGSQQQREQLRRQASRLEQQRQARQPVDQAMAPMAIQSNHGSPLGVKQERTAAGQTQRHITPENSSSPIHTQAPEDYSSPIHTQAPEDYSSPIQDSSSPIYTQSPAPPSREQILCFKCNRRVDPGPNKALALAMPAPSSSRAVYGTQMEYDSNIAIGDSRNGSDGDDDDEGGQTGSGPAQEKNHDQVMQIIEHLSSLPDPDLPPKDRKKTPPALAVKLLPHQQVGLTWLMQQEESNHRGSILADGMGLGKTIQALALILARPSKDYAYKTTLIVAPVALLEQWEREITDKVNPHNRLKTIILYGQKKKRMSVANLLSYDVVLTTYGTIRAEFSPWKNTKAKNLILATRFHRIILDEAHNIKNDKSKTAQACWAIRATYRLCMTGTPMMNNVRELFSLIRFLRISPYDVWSEFHDAFDKPLKKAAWEHGHALRSLQAFLAGVLLQRTPTSQLDGKQVLNLPPLESSVAETKFNDDQRDFYNHLEHKMRLRFNKYMKAGTVMKNYTFILVLILRLRQCCCHPYLVMNHGIPDGAELKPKEMISLAWKLDNHIIDKLKEQQEFCCPLCNDIVENPVILYPCGHHLCGDCFTGLMLVRDVDTNDEDGGERTFQPCASQPCRAKLDPRKVLCYSFFKEAHMPDVSDAEVDEEDLEDLDDDISDDFSDADEYGNLKGFIVSDEEESVGMSDDEDDNKDTKLQTRDRKNASNARHYDDDSDEAPTEQENPADKGERPTNSNPQKHPRTDDNDTDESDSDGSLAPLSELWQRAEEQKKTPKQSPFTPRSGGLPFKRTVKRDVSSSPLKPVKEELDLFRQSGGYFDRLAQQSASKNPALKKPKPEPHSIKEEGSDEESGNRASKRQRVSRLKHAASAQTSDLEDPDSSEEGGLAGGKRKRSKGKGIARPKSNEQQSRRRKDKKKKKGTKEIRSLAELKVESIRNAAAKAKYLKRLRKDYESSAKIDRTMELLREIQRNDPKEKTLIFSVFTSFLDLLEIPIQDGGFIYQRYDGSMPQAARDAAVQAFMKKPDVTIMLVSLRAGNAGLNLQAATQVIILDPFWNPSVEDQAVGRSHRLGQDKPVTVHRTLVDDTIEDRILALQEKKRALVGEVLNNEVARSMTRLSVADLAGLLGIGRGRQTRRG
ncbi:putative SNF2 family N-terminal domain-containing protein [Seiridium cardinale]|uniref:SNF2 family N-terminal domain-containing protein n=1 Tax=Seiridium cardinale TaxID=138064 RepID=A0ABR2Y7Z6_9PEZI